MSRRYPYLSVCPGCGLEVRCTSNFVSRPHAGRRRRETDYPGPCPVRCIPPGPALPQLVYRDGRIETWSGEYTEEQMDPNYRDAS